MIQTTLCLILKDNPTSEILLGLKKRGFGKGNYCGFGGKIKATESIKTAAIRELYEESGLITTPDALEPFGSLTFHFPTKPDWDLQVSLFTAQHWDGFPRETEEMLPVWFPVSQIPFKEMWADAIHWLPIVLNGHTVNAYFEYGDDNQTIAKHQITLC